MTALCRLQNLLDLGRPVQQVRLCCRFFARHLVLAGVLVGIVYYWRRAKSAASSDLQLRTMAYYVDVITIAMPMTAQRTGGLLTVARGHHRPSSPSQAIGLLPSLPARGAKSRTSRAQKYAIIRLAGSRWGRASEVD